MLEEGSSTCTTPVLHLSFFALHWSSDTGSMPVTYLRKLGERTVWRLHFARGRDRQIYLVLPTATAKSLQSCPTLCDPIDGSPLGYPVPGILQARTLEWVAISFSNAWKWKVKGKSLSHVWLLTTPWTAAQQAPPSTGFSKQEYWSGVPLPSPGLPRAAPTWKGQRKSASQLSFTNTAEPKCETTPSAPLPLCDSQILLLWRRSILSLVADVGSMWFWRFPVRGAPAPRCWAEYPQEKMVHFEKLERNLRKQTCLSKRKIPHVTPSPTVSLPKLVARCQAVQVVMMLLFDEKRRYGSWEKGACSFLQNLLQDTTSGSQILIQWSPSLQVTSYNPLWLQPDWSLSSLSYCKTPQGHNFWQRGLDTSSRTYVSPPSLSRNTHADAVFSKQEKGAGLTRLGTKVVKTSQATFCNTETGHCQLPLAGGSSHSSCCHGSNKGRKQLRKLDQSLGLGGWVMWVGPAESWLISEGWRGIRSLGWGRELGAWGRGAGGLWDQAAWSCWGGVTLDHAELGSSFIVKKKKE